MRSYFDRCPKSLLLLLPAFFIGCASALYSPSQQDVTWANRNGISTSLSRLREGRILYVQTCAGCHNLPRPEKYAPQKWPKLVREMVREQDVQLESRDSTLMVEFLRVASERSGTP